MFYVTNRFNHYFAITPKAWLHFTPDVLVSNGCVIHDSESDMYAFVMKAMDLQLDEVDGLEIIFFCKSGRLFESTERNMSLEPDTGSDANQYLYDYRS